MMMIITTTIIIIIIKESKIVTNRIRNPGCQKSDIGERDQRRHKWKFI